MLPRRSPAGPQNPSFLSPSSSSSSFHSPPPLFRSPPSSSSTAAAAAAAADVKEEEDEEEGEALSVSDQRTLYLVNIFVGNTARFLNSFASLCHHKLAHLHRRIVRLDASLTLLESNLKRTHPCRDIGETSGFEAMTLSSQNSAQNVKSAEKRYDLASGPGESSSIR